MKSGLKLLLCLNFIQVLSSFEALSMEKSENKILKPEEYVPFGLSSKPVGITKEQIEEYHRAGIVSKYVITNYFSRGISPGRAKELEVPFRKFLPTTEATHFPIIGLHERRSLASVSDWSKFFKEEKMCSAYKRGTNWQFEFFEPSNLKNINIDDDINSIPIDFAHFLFSEMSSPYTGLPEERRKKFEARVDQILGTVENFESKSLADCIDYISMTVDVLLDYDLDQVRGPDSQFIKGESCIFDFIDEGVGVCTEQSRVFMLVFDYVKSKYPQKFKNVYLTSNHFSNGRFLKKIGRGHAFNTLVIVNKDKVYFSYLDVTHGDIRYGGLDNLEENRFLRASERLYCKGEAMADISMDHFWSDFDIFKKNNKDTSSGPNKSKVESDRNLQNQKSPAASHGAKLNREEKVSAR